MKRNAFNKLGDKDGFRRAEFEYQRTMNRWVGAFSSGLFLFFAGYHFFRGSTFQTGIFVILFINTIFGLLWLIRETSIDRVIRRKHIMAGIDFILLAVSFFVGLFSKDIYLFLPWFFIYSVAVIFFYGKRIGIFSAIIFTAIAIPMVQIADLPPWNAVAVSQFKFHIGFSLFGVMFIALLIEGARFRAQNNLVMSQYQYQEAERRQREINEKLQHEIDLRIESQKKLEQSEIRYRALFEESTVSLWEEDWSDLKKYLNEIDVSAEDLKTRFKADPRITTTCRKLIRMKAVNRTTLNLFEVDDIETLLNHINQMIASNEIIFSEKNGIDLLPHRIEALLATGRFQTEVDTQSITGKHLHLVINTSIPAGFEDSWAKVFTSIYDITERIRMEKEKELIAQNLQKVRHMQAVTTLAGGIAHQFNNALFSISGNLEIMKDDPQLPPSTHECIDAMLEASNRMQELTKQLLAYARGGKYQTGAISINNVIKAVLESDQFERDETVRIDLDLATDDDMVNGDITQIQKVVEAIIFNALESMSEGGSIHISTKKHRIAPPHHPTDSDSKQMPPGDYVAMIFQDNGSGMEQETRERMFEPFFSTKFFGRGLGMAAASGIIENHGGMITVESTPGQGTIVMVYLPASMD